MPKYRKQPFDRDCRCEIIVDAVQFDYQEELCGSVVRWLGCSSDPQVKTRDGWEPIGPGMWIVTDADGEQALWRSPHFESCFTPVKESPRDGRD